MKRLSVAVLILVAGCRFDPLPVALDMLSLDALSFEDMLPDFAAPPDLVDACSSLDCALGCGLSASGTAECKVYVPTEPVINNDFSLSSVSDISVASSAIFNTDTGEITGSVQRPPNASPTATQSTNGIVFVIRGGFGLFVMRNLTVTANSELRLIGTHAGVLVSQHQISVDGRIDARGYAGDDLCAGGVAGPGGSHGGTTSTDGSSGSAGSVTGDTNNQLVASGGGGGGYGTAGGKGGKGFLVLTALGGIGGTTQPLGLRGGGAGGNGGGIHGGLGGGGGGAILLVAPEQITLAQHARVTVSGCGGDSGGGDSGGGGGGSGGTLIVESPIVELDAPENLLAVGGGGGAGADGAPGHPNVSDDPSQSGSAGGAAGTQGTSGKGGDGARTDSSPGQNGSQSTRGGGGGGGAGRIVINTTSRQGNGGSKPAYVQQPLPTN